MTCPSFCAITNERVYIIAMGCEIELVALGGYRPPASAACSPAPSVAALTSLLESIIRDNVLAIVPQHVRGILNLARAGIIVEIRIVLVEQNIERLPSLAQFISRNLPLASHVAFMGLEPIGFAKANLRDVWVVSFDYEDLRTKATLLLSGSGMNVSIYNHQLCVLEESVRHFARRNISDWKLEYLEGCSSCCVRERCCGFFSSATKIHSAFIHAIAEGH